MVIHFKQWCCELYVLLLHSLCSFKKKKKYSTQKETVPKPCFMQKTIQDVGIGTFRNIATVQQTASVYDALSVFVERRVSALPVVNEQGGLT